VEEQQILNEGEQLQVYANQVKQLYKRFPVTVFINVIIATMLVVVQWPVVKHGVLVGWWSGIVLITAIRWVFAILYKKSAPAFDKTGAWGTGFFVGSVCAGLAWGSAAFLLFPGNDVEHLLFVLFALAGISSLSITTLAPRFEVVQVFLFTMLVPLIVHIFLIGK
jgi:hypothetical protein